MIRCVSFHSSSPDNKYLYKIEYTYVDMEVDENGLWAIYGGDQRENDFMVAKLNAESLQVNNNLYIDKTH